MKKYLLMLSCVVVCAGFVGCSDDEDDGVSVKSLVGRWFCYQEEEYLNGELSYMDDEFLEGVELFIAEFNADGTGGWFDGDYLSELDDEKFWDRFTYTLSGSQLFMQGGRDLMGKSRVEKVTSSELVLVWEELDDMGNKWIERFYFRRMN